MTALEPQRSGEIRIPRASPISQPFWEGCDRGVLPYQRCDSCSKANFNPVYICRFCTSKSLSWHESAGLGTIYSWTIAWRPQFPSFATPYAPIIVDLDEGYQMISNLVGCDTEEVHVGMRISTYFHRVADRTLPYFTPLEISRGVMFGE